ncbi:RNA polymerase sigma factor [Thiomicrorhabdus arctica]|uniref:RNA polymerase sigma factor n=1 Tax=Thiomicrorhabdus arctica TaxID=131540 RepID=UPI0003667B2A|nr:sigma-70 family RNA polymerase sigma factor [Thiomicrorhabdus arctica]
MIDKTVTDLELVKQVQKGHPHTTMAFESLVKRHEQKVYALCYRYLGDDSLARDVSQETFLKIFQQIKTFRGEAQFSTWLYRIALNHCHTQYKKKGLNYESLDDWLDDLQVSVQPDCADEADCIQYCLEQQEQQERAIMSMRFNAELSIQEIAEILNIKLSAAKMRLYRSIESFKTYYQAFCK